MEPSQPSDDSIRNRINSSLRRICFSPSQSNNRKSAHTKIMPNSVNAALTSAAATWLLLLAMTMMRVQATREEAAPVEQYNDSGETIRHAGVLIPTSVALKSLLSGKNNNNNVVGEEDEEGNDADVLKRASASWNKLHGGWGKRERDLELTDPEGAKNWNRLFGLVGKRAKWNELNGMWGKRGSEGQWNSLRGVWGKRQSPHWNNLRGMWGKK